MNEWCATYVVGGDAELFSLLIVVVDLSFIVLSSLFSLHGCIGIELLKNHSKYYYLSLYV